jgi:hypothetical protein
MTEEKLNALRQTDVNLRDALRMDEVERPQMPDDLNERLMKRVANEKKKPRRIVWPWIAAACVAGMMMIWLMPPKEEAQDVVAELQTPPLTPRGVNTPEANKVEEPLTAKVETEVQQPATAPTNIQHPVPTRRVKPKVRRSAEQSETKLMAQETPTVETALEETKDLATTLPSRGGAGSVTQEQSVTLTERDIPVTRPENYKYTSEELALMKKQAYEAYLKWAELELEIAKYNLEQTAQK